MKLKPTQPGWASRQGQFAIEDTEDGSLWCLLCDPQQGSLFENEVVERHRAETICDAVNSSGREELNRLRSGNFTPQELHRICHNMHQAGGCWPVTAHQFMHGCEQEQAMMFGWSPSVAYRWLAGVVGLIVGVAAGLMAGAMR